MNNFSIMPLLSKLVLEIADKWKEHIFWNMEDQV